MLRNSEGEQISVEEWLSILKNAALKIDPETAEVGIWWAQTVDPYDIEPDLPEECDQVEKMYFARTPGDIWVSFYDLPTSTKDALLEMAKARRQTLDVTDEDCPF